MPTDAGNIWYSPKEDLILNSQYASIPLPMNNALE